MWAKIHNVFLDLENAQEVSVDARRGQSFIDVRFGPDNYKDRCAIAAFDIHSEAIRAAELLVSAIASDYVGVWDVKAGKIWEVQGD